MTWKMPERRTIDGGIALEIHEDDDLLEITATTMGETSSILVSRYNAARIVGALSMFLEMPLGKVGKAIKM